MSIGREILATRFTPLSGVRIRAARLRTAFSLIEVVVVVVITGIIAAIAIPKLSRGATGASDAVHSGDLRVLRDAVNRYYIEHGIYPSADDDGGQAKVAAQLTGYTDSTGNASATKEGAFTYGPYVRQIPCLSVGSNRGNKLISAAAGAGVAWIYDETTGEVIPNTGTDADAQGKLYNSY